MKMSMNYFVQVRHTGDDKFTPIGYVSSLRKAKEMVKGDCDFAVTLVVTSIGKTKIYKNCEQESL